MNYSSVNATHGSVKYALWFAPGKSRKSLLLKILFQPPLSQLLSLSLPVPLFCSGFPSACFSLNLILWFTLFSLSCPSNPPDHPPGASSEKSPTPPSSSLSFPDFSPSNLPLLPVLSITSNLTHSSKKKIIFFSPLSSQQGGLQIHFYYRRN